MKREKLIKKERENNQNFGWLHFNFEKIIFSINKFILKIIFQGSKKYIKAQNVIFLIQFDFKFLTH
jgi:hypothetical protein